MKYTIQLKKAKVVKVYVGNKKIGEVPFSPSGKFLFNLLVPFNKKAIENFFVLYDVPNEIEEVVKKVLQDFDVYDAFFEALSQNPTEVVTIEIEDYPSEGQ